MKLNQINEAAPKVSFTYINQSTGELKAIIGQNAYLYIVNDPGYIEEITRNRHKPMKGINFLKKLVSLGKATCMKINS